MLTFRFMILFWVTTRIGLHALNLKNTSIFSVCTVWNGLFSAPVPLRPLFLNTQSPLIGQLAHAWATANTIIITCRSCCYDLIMQICDIVS